MKAVEYFNQEYGAGHIPTVVIIKDYASLYGLIEEYSNHKTKPLLVLLESIDDLLSRLEDYAHGKDGVDITMMRGEIQRGIKQLNIK